MPKMLINKINKGANRGKTQPVQHRGLEAFWKDVLEYNNFEANFYSIPFGALENKVLYITSLTYIFSFLWYFGTLDRYICSLRDNDVN